MSGQKCCCTEATNEYMDFLTNNLSFDEMYQSMTNPNAKEDNKLYEDTEQCQGDDELRPLYDYQTDGTGNDIDYDDLIRHCKSGEYNPYLNKENEKCNYEGNCNRNTQYLKDMDEFYIPNRANIEEDDMDYDLEYMKGMYPKEAKKVLMLVEDECDKLEYSGSCMFDEYPDRVSLGKIVIQIYEMCKSMEEEGSEDNAVEVNQLCNGRYCPYYNCADCFDNGKPNWLYQMIQTMLYQEMINRRRRYRRWR